MAEAGSNFPAPPLVRAASFPTIATNVDVGYSGTVQLIPQSAGEPSFTIVDILAIAVAHPAENATVSCVNAQLISLFS